VLYCLTCPCSQ